MAELTGKLKSAEERLQFDQVWMDTSVDEEGDAIGIPPLDKRVCGAIGSRDTPGSRLHLPHEGFQSNLWRGSYRNACMRSVTVL